MSRRQVLAEITLVFAVFFLEGAYPAPDVNEPYYLGKAIHFWNPHWIPGDFFLESADTHQVFYCTFGWLSLCLPPLALAWFGRALTWGLLAWAWQRLSFAVAPRRWFAVLSAALLVCLFDHFNLPGEWVNFSMAGEWIIGGVEAKGFAYVLVLLGLEALARDRWNRTWLLLGAAAAFHVLVGGWSIVAAGFVWLVLGKDRPTLRRMYPGLAGGLLFSLLGLVPSLRLNWGVDADTLRQANEVYVYQRLSHHLSLADFPATSIACFVLLCIVWLLLCRLTERWGAAVSAAPQSPAVRRLRAFVSGSIVIALAGTAVSLLGDYDRAAAAGLLRFYWFRLADVMVPLGVALTATVAIASALDRRPTLGRRCLIAAIAIAGANLGADAGDRCTPRLPRADDPLCHYDAWRYESWRLACQWVAESEEIPPDARFLTPRLAQTFKWYAGRAEVVNWKEVPQDARAIVEWWRRINAIHGTGSPDPEEVWYESLAHRDAASLLRLGKRYQADYVLTEARPRLALELLYRNEDFAVYRLAPESEQQEPP